MQQGEANIRTKIELAVLIWQHVILLGTHRWAESLVSKRMNELEIRTLVVRIREGVVRY